MAHDKAQDRELYSRVAVRLARSRKELEAAYALVYREYLRNEYIQPNPARLKYSFFNALPDTATFIVLFGDAQVIGTATVIPDSHVGLPLDRIYHAELDRLRATGKKICEISMLAMDTVFLRKHHLASAYQKYAFMLRFFKVILDYVKSEARYDYMCIAVNPRNSDIYDTLLFKDFGPVKAYPEVNNALAVAKYLDVHGVAEGFRKAGKEKLYRIFVEQSTPPSSFRKKKELTQNDLRYFFVKKQPFFRSMTRQQRSLLARYYPSAKIEDSSSS